MGVLSTQENDFAQSAYALVRDWIGSRMQIRFWLSLDKREDCEVLEIIDSMKDKRTFRRSVMLGLKMVWELKQGRVDTLLKEFPDVIEWLKVKVTPPDDGLLDEIRDLKRMMLEQGGNTIQPQTLIMKSSGAGLPAAPIAEVKQAAAVSADDIADNFLSMFQ